MPIGGTARVTASVNGGHAPPPITLWAGQAVPVRFTVSSAARDAYDAATVHLGATILLSGVDITEHLRGAIEVLDGVDEPHVTATFELAGRQWLAHRTLETWTRTPLRILFHQGASQDQLQTETAFDGVVITHAPVQITESSGYAVPGVRIEAKDRAYLYGEQEVCDTVEPLAGLRRDQIAAQVAAAAGVPTDIPPGAVYTKGVETGGQALRRWLADFGEPENWSWRLGADGQTLEAYVAELKEAPRAPDAVWPLDDLYSQPTIQPPTDVASTWVLRGSSGVQVDELGFTTKLQVITVKGVYTPAAAAQQQLADGTVLPFSSTSLPAERTISRLTVITTCRGDRPVRQTTLEQGWRNPAAAPFTTDGPGGLGQGPEDGYYYLAAYIDERGRFVAWPVERFGHTSRQELHFDYAADGSAAGESRATYRYHAIRRAVRDAASVDGDGNPVPNVGGTLIGDDGASYRDRGHGVIEAFGLAERQELAVRYGENGAQAGDQLETTRFLAVRTHVRERANTAAEWIASGYLANADGGGMQTVDELWQLAERVTRNQLVDDGHISSQTAHTERHVEQRALHGTYDFGDYVSNVAEERWGTAERTAELYTVLSSEQYQRTPVVGGQAGPPETHSGRPPAPLWRASAWTRLVQTPIELVFDDDTLRQWFGPRTQVLSNEHIQDLVEARRVLERHLLRELSYELRVVRPDTRSRASDTVLVLDRDQRLFRRFLLLSRRRRRTLAPVPSAELECQLISPLPIAFTTTVSPDPEDRADG